MIKVATGTHITDYHAPGAYQWSYTPGLEPNFADSVTISGGWNPADNCQTQVTLDPAQTVLDARYWGPVFSVTTNSINYDFTGSVTISNLTFYRGESNEFLPDAAILMISGGGLFTFDNILVTGNRSGAASAAIATFGLSGSGILKVRNSEFLNNSFTHTPSGGVFFVAESPAIGIFTNNSIRGNTATTEHMGLEVRGLVTLSNNAIGDNSSTYNPSYDFFSRVPTELTLVNNHFETSGIFNGTPDSQVNTTTGDPAWTLVGTRMVPDAVSPLRDSGDNDPLGEVPVIDFSGNPRIANVTIDRGAVEAEAPPASPVGPLVTAVSPANGSTTVFQGAIGSGFVYTELTFDVSGGVSPGVTKLECSKTSGPLTFGIGSSGETVGVGDTITPIVVGFDDITSEPQSGTITCAAIRDLAGTSYLTFNFVATPPGGPAVFDSSPKKAPDPASTIELTDGPGAIVGTDLFGTTLSLFNVADLGDSDLLVTCEFGGGSDPQITATPVGVSDDLIAPQGALNVTFDCDTATPGNYSASYNCVYDLDTSTNPATEDGTATYAVECDVRPPPKTDVETTPPSGTTTTRVVESDASANFEFIFAEVSPDPDPPADAFLYNCFIDGTDPGRFSIDSPAFPGGPYPIVNGAPQTVQVTGTDDGSKYLYTANLNCEYSDSDHPSICEGGSSAEQVEGPPACRASVNFPLVLEVRRDAKFRVTKEFTDGDNPTEVDVTITCNTGLPLTQTQTISETSDVVFVVESFDRDQLDCSITEDTSAPELAGYAPTYTAGGPADLDNVDGCHFHDIAGGADFTCGVVNDAEPVELVIEKLWVIEGEGGDEVDQHFELTLYCDAEIDGGEKECYSGGHGEYPGSNPAPAYESCLEFEGQGSGTFTAWVTPEWPGSRCWVDERVFDDSVEIRNDCGDLTISHGQGDSCLVTNTVFFEGIPALSRYGLAILALFMLGVGLAGFRRYS